MAILVSVGRAAIIQSLKEQPIHLAWGPGDPDWDTTPELPNVSTTALINEIGRRAVSQVNYCLPDPDGEIDVATGRFTVSATPTKYLYMRFSYDFADAAGETIRQLGLFIGTQVKNTVPPGKMYLLPADIEDPGTLFLLEHTKIERSDLLRQRFEFVFQA